MRREKLEEALELVVEEVQQLLTRGYVDEEGLSHPLRPSELSALGNMLLATLKRQDERDKATEGNQAIAPGPTIPLLRKVE